MGTFDTNLHATEANLVAWGAANDAMRAKPLLTVQCRSVGTYVQLGNDLGARAMPADDEFIDAIAADLVEGRGAGNRFNAAFAAMKPTCDEAGNWRYVPAAEIDGPRVPRKPATIDLERKGGKS